MNKRQFPLGHVSYYLLIFGLVSRWESPNLIPEPEAGVCPSSVSKLHKRTQAVQPQTVAAGAVIFGPKPPNLLSNRPSTLVILTHAR